MCEQCCACHQASSIYRILAQPQVVLPLIPYLPCVQLAAPDTFTALLIHRPHKQDLMGKNTKYITEGCLSDTKVLEKLQI